MRNVVVTFISSVLLISDIGLLVRRQPRRQPASERDPLHCDGAAVGHAPDGPPAQPAAPTRVSQVCARWRHFA